MSSKAKKAKAKKEEKIPQKDNEIPEIDYPVFDFRYLHKDYSLDTKKVQKNDKIRLISALHKLSQHSWQELKLAPRHGLGAEKIAHNAINPGMSNCKWVKKDTIFLAFRYHGLKEIVGVRNGSVFHILYIDYNRKVYDH